MFGGCETIIQIQTHFSLSSPFFLQFISLIWKWPNKIFSKQKTKSSQNHLTRAQYQQKNMIYNMSSIVPPACASLTQNTTNYNQKQEITSKMGFFCLLNAFEARRTHAGTTSAHTTETKRTNGLENEKNLIIWQQNRQKTYQK